jgi:hypothetical protein
MGIIDEVDSMDFSSTFKSPHNNSSMQNPNMNANKINPKMKQYV